MAVIESKHALVEAMADGNSGKAVCGAEAMEEGKTNLKLPCYLPRRMPSNAEQLKSEVWGTDLLLARSRIPTAESTRCCARHFASSICSVPPC